MEQTSTPDYSEFHSDNFGEITNIVWDGDNTLWPWVSYAAPAYEAMCQILAQESGKTEDEVADAMRTIYAEAGTMEYANLIQDLDAKGFFDGMAKYDQDDMVDKVQQAFSRIRSKKLKLYDGIKDVVETVHDHKIKNIMLTDAPEYQAQMRLKRSKLFKYIKDIFAMQSPELKDMHPKFKERQERGDYKIEFGSKAVNTEKPHTNLEEILNMTREQIRRHVVVIGDNPNKDMALVDTYECRGILAGYGKPDPADLETLKRYAPPRISNRNAVTSESITREVTNSKGLILVVDSPKQILDVLKLSKAA